jgi:GNAT superfamily N-acetyltransferase
LETGAPPDRTTVAGFFDDLAPNGSPDRTAHLGVYEGDQIVGVLAMSYGYPQAADCYIGYLVLAHMVRGQGYGVAALGHATQLAQGCGATRQLVAVLDANPKARAFWEREGFILEQSFPDTGDGHIRHRLIRSI